MTRRSPTAVLLVGIQASGKSTFYRDRFFDTHVRISRDLVRTAHRERLLLDLCVSTLQPFVVDKTNPTAAERRPVIDAARRAGFCVVGYVFETRPRDAIERNERRLGRARIPVVGILGTHKRLEPPRYEEGFDELYRVCAEGGSFTIEPLPLRWAARRVDRGRSWRVGRLLTGRSRRR